MNSEPKKASNRDLRRSWLRFSEIVRMFAEKRTQRNEIGAQDYETIHRELLQAIDDAMESSPDQRELYARMKELAAPWVHLGALQQADTQLLKDLSKRCDGFCQQLTHGKAVQLSMGVSLTVLIALFLGTFALMAAPDLWAGLYDRIIDGSGGTLADWFQALERNRNHSRTWLIAGVLPVATSAVAWFVFRAPRNY